jgi:CubicO group peptidase (beta-lactamase class C family)
VVYLSFKAFIKRCGGLLRNIRMSRYNYILILLILNFGCSCENNYQKRISNLVDNYAENESFNGIIKVYQNNQVIYDKAFGYADFETERKLTTKTPFRIGSISKTFTAISILILNERGKLQLSDTIGKFINYFPDRYNQVTIEELLSHTSGIPDYMDNYPQKTDSLTSSDAIDSLKNKDELYFQPGSNFRYSNSGYLILGLIVESITKQSLQDFIHENILQPLEMNDTYFIQPENFMRQDRAFGYDSLSKIWEIPLFVKGDGGMVSTTDDLYKWYSGLINNKIITDTVFDNAIKHHKLKNGELINYGLGFEVNSTKQGFDLVGHRGGLGGTGVYFIFESKIDNLIIVMTNNACQKTGEIVERISMIINDFDYNTKDE